jgi:hypothetical protein
MSGAWERERPSVLVAILTREIVTTKWAVGFRNLALPSHSGISFRTGAPYDVMRNSACADALAANFQWVFFLDDDVIPPADALLRLLTHGKDVASGLYYRRQEPICPVAMKLDGQGKAQWVTSWNPPACLLEVDLVGSGCLLIHRRVLDGMTSPWFEWEIGKPEPAVPRGRGAMSEDFAFCMNAKAAGFKVHLDTSIRCEHVGLGQSSQDGSFRPSGLP